MKIVLFTENNYCGGLDIFLTTLINYWPDPADKLVLICNRTHPGLEIITERVSRELSIQAHDLPMALDMLEHVRRLPGGKILSKALSPLVRYVTFVRHLHGIRGMLKREQPDRLMVVNGGYPGGDTCRAAILAWNSMRGSRPPAIHNVHNLASRSRWWERPAENFIDRRVAGSTLALVAVSRACAASIPENRPLAAGVPVKVIYNGIATPQAVPANSLLSFLGIGSDVPLGLMLGTYEPRKGHDYLLQAWQQVVRQLPKARLVIAGFGYPPQFAHVQALVAHYGLEANVTLLGFRSDTTAMIADADVLLVASQAFESFGLTLVEAMAQQVPVVATITGGIPEVVGDGEAGFLVSPHDPDGFAQRIITLLADPDLRQRLGRQGYARYREMFTANRMAGEYAALVKGDVAA